MGIRDFKKPFQLHKRKLFAVICINQAPGGKESRMNEMLETVVKSLKTQLPEYEEVNLAYVYETSGLMGVHKFKRVTQDTVTCYKDPCENEASHSPHHIFFMGMVMIEKALKECPDAQSRLYLLTDEKFERVNHIVWQGEDGPEMIPRFQNMLTKIILYKTEKAGGGAVEEYLRRSPVHEVVELSDGNVKE